MRTLYFDKEDLAIREKEMRRLFWQQVEDEQLSIAKKRLEEALRFEFDEALEAEAYERTPDRRGYRGGYRYRDLQTWGGRLYKVKVPKGEKGYRFKLLEPWARHVEKFTEAVYRAFVYGMSDRKVAKFFGTLYGEGILSPAGVSVIYQNLSRDVETWHRRPLEDAYRFFFLDGMVQPVRDTLGHDRTVLAALGVRKDGTWELIDFRVDTGESASAWGRFIQNLYERGLVGKNLELVIHDGCPGLIDALRFVWPYTQAQLCAVHHLRNLGKAIQARHIRGKVLREARRVYQARNKAQALKRARRLSRRWSRCEPRALRNFMRRLEATLVYMEFPQELWTLIKSTNHLERYLREWRRRLRAMGCLPNPLSCDRILYALVQEYNGQRKKVPQLQKSELYLT